MNRAMKKKLERIAPRSLTDSYGMLKRYNFGADKLLVPLR
jgi:hypothetical protein